LILRRWRVSDRAPFALINADSAVMQFFPSALTAEESGSMLARIEAHFEEHGFGLWAAELRTTGEFIGFVGLSIPRFKAAFTPCVEIGWRLSRRYWHLGLATEGAREVVRCAFEDLGLPSLVSFTAAGNLPSRRVMEKLGMSHDPRENFGHPSLAEGHPLRLHVLYRLDCSDWKQRGE